MQGAAVVFLNEEVRRARIDLHGCRGGDRADVHVRRDHGVVGFGDGRDLLRFEYSAALADVQLDDLRGLLLQQFGELVERHQALAGGDGDAGVGGDPGHFVHVFRRHRFLEPERLVFLEHLGDADCAGGAELAMRADADFQLVADGIANGAEDLRRVLDGLQRKIAGQREVGHERVDLAGGVAFLHQLLGNRAGAGGILPDAFRGHVGVGAQLLVAATAEEVVDGLAGGLADDVPQGHFDGRQRWRSVQAGMAVVVVGGVDLLPDRFDVEGALADDEAGDDVVQQGDLRFQIGRVAGGPFA